MINERIKQIRKEKRLTQTEFGSKIGVNQCSVVDWERGRSFPSVESMKSMAKCYGINLHWLMTGEGTMYLPHIDELTLKAELKQKVYNFIRNEISILENNDGLLPPGVDDYWYLPIEGEIVAGIPQEFCEDSDRMYHVPILKKQLINPDECNVLKVNGDSMEPSIEHSDLVVIKRTDDWMSCNHKVVAARTSDGLTLKKLVYDPLKNSACLIAFNSKYKPIFLNEDSVICGYMILLVRQC
jgi:SOS-response transcriptional repressor LexA